MSGGPLARRLSLSHADVDTTVTLTRSQLIHSSFMTLPATSPEEPGSTAAAIAAFNEGRDPDLIARKYAAMRQSAFAFMRGTCHLFFDTLPPVAALQSAPLAWVCGDMHVENFGTYKGDNRLTYFDVTDFDETALGPVTLDLVRFLASILVGAEEWGVIAEEAAAVASRALVAYTTELASGKASWIERESARGLIKRLFAQVAGRSRTELLDRFTTRKGKRRRFTPDGKHVLAAGDQGRATVDHILARVASVARDEDYFRVVDVARRVAGIGSLGMPRFIALVEGRGSPDRNVLLDIKAARDSVLLPIDEIVQPEWADNADRVVSVQRHCAVVAPAFLYSGEATGNSFSIRELQLIDDRVRLKDWEKQPKKLGEAMITMAAVAAWMHLRGCAWRGSASIEQLGQFARAGEWSEPLLASARDAALRVQRQYLEFVDASERGYFKM